MLQVICISQFFLAICTNFNGSFPKIMIDIQCWFKLTGQSELNLKTKTRFSQIGLSLGENLWRQNLLKVLAALIWCNFFCEVQAQNFTPKIGLFGFS